MSSGCREGEKAGSGRERAVVVGIGPRVEAVDLDAGVRTASLSESKRCPEIEMVLLSSRAFQIHS